MMYIEFYVIKVDDLVIDLMYCLVILLFYILYKLCFLSFFNFFGVVD